MRKGKGSFAWHVDSILGSIGMPLHVCVCVDTAEVGVCVGICMYKFVYTKHY